jgi:hypothetical protein
MQNDIHVIAEAPASNQEAPVWIMEDPFARAPRARFTIARIMIAIAVVAGLLALPLQLSLIIIALAIPCGAVGIARRLVYRRQLRLAAFGFWGVAIPLNFLTVLSCIAPNSYLLIPIFLGLVALGIPTIAAIGTAWALLFARQKSVSPRTRDGAGMAVFFLAVLPIVTLWSFWPLHLAFMASRPTMDRLADEVAAGKPVFFPRRAGVFVVFDGNVNPVTGDVGLMIDSNPNRPSGFVRTSPVSASGPGSPIVGSNLNVELGGGWSYREDD